MTLLVNKKLLSHLLKISSKKYIKCLASVRFKSNDNVEQEVSGKIEAAILKKFSDSLQIESVDPPKRLQSTEVSITQIVYIK